MIRPATAATIKEAAATYTTQFTLGNSLKSTLDLMNCPVCDDPLLGAHIYRNFATSALRSWGLTVPWPTDFLAYPIGSRYGLIHKHCLVTYALAPGVTP